MATGQLQLQPQCFAGGVKHNELCAEPLLEEVCKDLTALLLKVAQEQVTSSDKAMSEKRAHLVTCTCRHSAGTIPDRFYMFLLFTFMFFLVYI